MEFVGIKPLVQDDTPGGQPMVRIVLVVLVAVFISSNSFSAQPIVLALNIAASVLRSLTCNFIEESFEIDPQSLFQWLHSLIIDFYYIFFLP